MMYAYGFTIGFTHVDNSNGAFRNKFNTHGFPAITQLLEQMNNISPDNRCRKYGHFVLWLDGVLRS